MASRSCGVAGVEADGEVLERVASFSGTDDSNQGSSVPSRYSSTCRKRCRRVIVSQCCENSSAEERNAKASEVKRCPRCSRARSLCESCRSHAVKPSCAALSRAIRAGSAALRVCIRSRSWANVDAYDSSARLVCMVVGGKGGEVK